MVTFKLPRGQPTFVVDARQNVANVAGQHQLHVNETYPSILPSYWQSITAASGGTQLESMECARLIIGSISGNHMMFIGGLDQAAPFSGRGTPLYPGLEGEREIFIENSNRVRICAAFSGEMVYYMGYINGQPTSISSTTQGSQPNNQPPFLVRTDPLDGEHNVSFQGSGNTFISTFDENIASGTADVSSYSIRLSGNFDTVLSGVVDYYQPDDAEDRSKIRLTTASGELIGSSWYNVYIGQRISDDFGSNITSTLTWSFITAGVDDSPMFVQSFSPLSGTPLLPFSQQITATFSKRVSGTINATGFTNNIFLWNDNTPNLGVSGVTQLSDQSGRTLTFTPIALLSPSTLYRYSITGVQDLFNNYASPQSGIAFSTIAADTAGPIISSFSPVSGASGIVPTLTNLVVTFDERLSGILGGNISGQVISLVNSGAQGTPISGVITLNASGNVLTFDPASELISGTAYLWNVSGVYDLNGNILTQTVPPRSGIPFRTWVEADVTPPSVSITPASGSLGISHGINVVATFNEVISGTAPDAAFTTIIAVNLSGTGNVAGATSLDATGRIVTFNPSADLSGDRTYYVSVSGALDLASNRMSPVSGHPFRTLDNIAPVVSGITPISGSIDNLLTVNVEVTISEAISGTANGSLTADVIRLYKSGVPGTSFAGARTLDSTRTVITFNPTANLDPDEHYQVGVSGILDVSGNMMAAGGRVSGHSFVTAGGPLITATNPVSGQSGVALNSNIVVTFNKVISGTLNGTIVNTVFKLWVSAAAPVALAGTNTLNSDGTQLTFNPTADLLDTKTYVWAVSGVRDLSGFVITQTNPPRSGFTFDTIVVDAAPPTITTTVPASGVSGVSTNTTYVVNFSETISGNSGSAMPAHTVRMWVSSASPSFLTGTNVKTADSQITFTPSAELSGDRWYRVGVTGVYDLALNQITQTSPPRSGMSFRTVDNLAPIVSSVTPSSGQTNVTITDNMTVTFGEACSGTSGGTIVAQVMSLIESGNPGVLLGGAITLSTDCKTFTFNPTNNLSYKKWHELRISGIRDRSDNFMAPVSGHAFQSQPQPLTTIYENVGTNERSFFSLGHKALGIWRESTGSSLNGEVIKRASFSMKRTGTSSTIIDCVIIQDIDPGGGDNGVEVVIGTAAFNSVSTTAGRVEFENLANTYAMTTDDWIGVRWSGASASADLVMYYSADNVDGTDTQYASWNNDWSNFDDRDVDAKLEV